LNPATSCFAGALAISAAVRAAWIDAVGREIVSVGVSGAVAGDHADTASSGDACDADLTSDSSTLIEVEVRYSK